LREGIKRKWSIRMIDLMKFRFKQTLFKEESKPEEKR